MLIPHVGKLEKFYYKHVRDKSLLNFFNKSNSMFYANVTGNV